MQEVTRRLIEELKKKVDEKTFVDVGIAIEKEYMVSRERFRTALKELEKDSDYRLWYVKVQDREKPTVIKILSKSDVDHEEVYAAAKELHKYRVSNIVIG